MLRLRFLVLAAALVLVFSVSVFAQQKCHDIRVLNQQTLKVNLLTGEGDWYLDLDSIGALFDLQPVSPTVQYIPGTSTSPNAVIGRYSNYQKIWDFGKGDTFTVSNYHATFPVPPGKAGLGTFNGTGKITGGTGIFEGATGTETESGPYVTWPTVDGNGVPWVMGKYNGMSIIRVCMNN